MWTKQYLLHPTKEEYFKTKHPVATSSMLIPMCIYYLYIAVSEINSWWVVCGMLGSMVFGAGLAYLFAVKVKIYAKVHVPILALISGSIIVIISLILA